MSRDEQGLAEVGFVDRSWIRFLALVLTGILILLGSFGTGARASVQVGEFAPDFTLPDYSGTPHSLSDYRGKCVLLTLIGYNCSRCLSAGPSVERVWEDFRDTRVFQTVAVDVWNGSVSGVQSFITQTGATYPVLMNGATLQFDDVGSYGIHNDNYLVVDANGIVRYTSNDGPYITTRFNDALVRETIRAWLPVGVEPATWESIKGLYR